MQDIRDEIAAEEIQDVNVRLAMKGKQDKQKNRRGKSDRTSSIVK